MNDLRFDELDPCCQKEIEINRRKNRIDSQLRKTDRSNIRYDIRNKVVTNLFDISSCVCCNRNETYDYTLLALTRKQYDVFLRDKYDDLNELTLISDDESDEELLNELMKSFEAENAIKNQDNTIRNSHKEESLDHVNNLILEGHSMVLHCYNEKSIDDVLIDLYLEKIATSYKETLFRRINIIDISKDFLIKWRIFNSTTTVNSSGILLIFIKSELKSFNCNLRSFVDIDNHSINDNCLMQYLDHTHVLSSNTTVETSDSVIIYEVDDDEEVNENSYCGDPKCDKKYFHEHIGLGEGSFTKNNDKTHGIEALSENIFYKI